MAWSVRIQITVHIDYYDPLESTVSELVYVLGMTSMLPDIGLLEPLGYFSSIYVT